jgi:hypothetical protein
MGIATAEVVSEIFDNIEFSSTHKRHEVYSSMNEIILAELAYRRENLIPDNG